MEDIKEEVVDYLSKRKYIEENFERAKKYYCPDDLIYDQLVKEGIINVW